MALSALNWKYVGTQSFVSGIAASHDAVYTLGTAAVYADGSARTPGSGSAWTWQRQVSGSTVAAYGVPPTNALSMSYIVAGDGATTSYTLASPDTTGTANAVVCGMNRASGAFAGWSSAQPFTSGFSGYWRGTKLFSSTAYDNVSMWESQEACILQYAVNSSGVSSVVAFGALLDPLSSDSGTCESDGRLYLFSGSGSAATVSTTFLSFTYEAPLGHATGNGNGHTGIFSPGTTTVATAARMQTFSVSSMFLSLSNNIVRVPLVYNNASGAFLGASRSFYVVRDAQSRLAWSDTGTTMGYILGASTNTTADALLLPV